MITHSLLTSSLNLRREPLSCVELAHILLAPFAQPTVEARQLVALVLQSVNEYLDKDGSVSPSVDDELLGMIAPLSSSMMMLASRLEIDLKSQVWTGDKTEDVRHMYTQIVLQLASFLLATTAGNPRATVQATLEQALDYLSTSTAQAIQQDVASTASKYRLPCSLATTVGESAQKTREGSKGLGNRLGAKLKAAFKGVKRGGATMDVPENAEIVEDQMAEDSGSDSGYQSRASTDKSAESAPEDDYHGHEHLAKMSARFITGLFSCSDLPQTTPDSDLMSLDLYIGDALYISGLPTSVHIHALNLLHRLKQRFPTATAQGKPDYGHRLYLSALMVSTKFLWDGYCPNTTWCTIGQEYFSLAALNEMELELCGYLAWNLDVDPQALSWFEADLWDDYRISLVTSQTAELTSSSEEWVSLSPSSCSSSTSTSNSSRSPKRMPLKGKVKAKKQRCLKD